MSEKNSPNYKILLAEDDASMRRFIEVTLRRAGFEVSSTEDGLQAMRTALEDGFDAVVADAMMPNMTGHDLCRFLRQHEQTKDLCLILLSGLDNADGAADNCLADAYLVKNPQLKENLVATLEKLLQRTSEIV